MRSWHRRTGMLAVALFAGVAHAQSYPAKPVRIVTVAPGSANDLVARFVAQELKAGLGQPVVVDNRGTIAADIVARAPPDGYTLLLYGSAVWISPFIYKNQAASPLNDLTPITLVASSPNVVVVHPSLPVKSARELIALAKRRPGELHYATGSLGAAPHLASVSLNGMFAPAKTPAAVIGTVQQEVARILTRPDAKERLANAGMDAVVTTPDEFAAIIKSEMVKWGKVIREARISAE